MNDIPKRALAAIASSGQTIGKHTVREITLGLAAILEQIKSPLVGGVEPKGFKEMYATMFVMTRSTEESEKLLVSGNGVFDKAVKAWVDTVPLSEGKQIVEACVASACRAAGIMPEAVTESTESGESGNPAAATDETGG